MRNGTAILAYLALGITQMLGCFALFDYWGWGAIASIFVMTLLLVFRLGFILCVGCFFGAMYGWGWPWYGALAISFPVLVMMAGVFVAAIALSAAGKKS